MAGLMTALALRESGVFTTIDVFEQTRTPSTAGAGLNIPPNAARLARSLGVDLDGGDPKGPHGAVDGGRAAILSETRMVWEDGSITRKPLDHNTTANDNAGFHHMHRLDLLMCLYKRVLEFAPERGVNFPIRVHLAKRLEAVSQDEESVTVTFSDGTTETGDLLIGADGVDSQVLEAVWPGVSTKRWTEVVVYRGLVPRDKVAAARKPDGSPLDYNPIETMSMDTRETPTAQHLTYWVRGGELLNVWLGYYEPNAEEFERRESDWFPADRDEMVGNMSKAFEGDPRHDDVVALTSLMESPTKWGLYDRDALENWTEGRVGLVGDAAHPMLPTFGQGAAQAFEDAAALGKCFELHGTDIYRALLHYERVRYYRATRFQFASKFLFKHLEPEDSPQRRKILAAVNERTTPSSITRSVRAATTRGSTRSTRARSATSCRSRSSDRGTSARGRRRSKALAGRSPPASGSRRSHGPATGPSGARSSHSTQRSTTAGSSSAARSTTSPSGRITTRAGPSSRACMAARTPRRSSATTTAGSPSGTCSTSVSGRSSEPPPSAPGTRRRSSRPGLDRATPRQAGGSGGSFSPAYTPRSHRRRRAGDCSCVTAGTA